MAVSEKGAPDGHVGCCNLFFTGSECRFLTPVVVTQDGALLQGEGAAVSDAGQREPQASVGRRVLLGGFVGERNAGRRDLTQDAGCCRVVPLAWDTGLLFVWCVRVWSQYTLVLAHAFRDEGTSCSPSSRNRLAGHLQGTILGS